MDNRYCLIIYPSASKDIESIYQYISIDLSNPVAANNWIEALYESFQKLILFPKMYPFVDNPFINDKTIRRMLVKNYSVFYRINDFELQVIRVIHTRSDYPALLEHNDKA